VKVCAVEKTPAFWKEVVRRGRGFGGEKMLMSVPEEKVCRSAWARGGEAGEGALFRIIEGWLDSELWVLM